MDEQTYEDYKASIEGGQVVTLGNVTASTVEELDYLREAGVVKPGPEQVIADLTTENADLTDQNSKLTTENGALMAQVGDLQKQNADLQAQNTDLQGQLAAAQKAAAKPAPTPGAAA